MIVKKPTLFVDKKKVMRNIQRITQKALITKTELYPHYKTHQSLEIGKWFKDHNVEGITVSSVSMAKYFANNGWDKIYIAFPININEIDDISLLASKVELTTLANEEAQIDSLIASVKSSVKVKIEIEAGANRSGVLPTDEVKIKNILMKLSGSIHKFDGFYSHFGHTYKAVDPAEVHQIYESSMAQIISLGEQYAEHKPRISIGDTPSASLLANYDGIKSMHAGNYVFYDLTQEQIGVCNESDIAIALAVPIVSKNVERLELIVYGGGIHLSKEVLVDKKTGKNIFGKIVELKDDDWEGSLDECYVSSISQEHGVVKVSQSVFDKFSIGDTIGILPVHSCMTADCMGGYLRLDGVKIDHFNRANSLEVLEK